MGQKIKFIIIGLAGFCIVCLFLFMQAVSQKQMLLRESNDLKTENTALANKANKLENDLREIQYKIGSLKAERDKGIEELNELQKKFELASQTRDELIERLKKSSQPQLVAPVAQPAQPPAPVLENTDAYWGGVLKAKTELEMQLSEIRVELKNLQMINATLQKEKNKTELEMQLSSVRAELRNLQINNESLQRAKGLLEIDINNLRNEKKDLSRQLDYNQKLLDSMSQEVVRERNDKTGIGDSFKTAKAENEALVRQLKSLVSRKMFLDKKVQDLQEGRSTLEKRLSEMEAMIADKGSKVDALKNELDTIKSGKREASDRERESVELPAIVVRSVSSAEKSKAQTPESSGKILAVNLDNNFVVIDLGSSSGVYLGNIFNVYRDAKLIGSISVIQTRANISACDIKKMSAPFKIGDNIK
jgi:chromosome segregation ATPase